MWAIGEAHCDLSTEAWLLLLRPGLGHLRFWSAGALLLLLPAFAILSGGRLANPAEQVGGSRRGEVPPRVLTSTPHPPHRPTGPHVPCGPGQMREYIRDSEQAWISDPALPRITYMSDEFGFGTAISDPALTIKAQITSSLNDSRQVWINDPCLPRIPYIPRSFG